MEYYLHNEFFDTYISNTHTYTSEVAIESPKISIITSYYNGNELIFDTAKCILGQTFQDFEWLVVNDGSTNENSLDILSSFAKLDGRISILHHDKNKGLPAGRNTGIKAAKGNYLFFIDSDDLIDITALEKFYLFLTVNKEYSFVNSYVVGFGNQNYLWEKGFEQKDGFLKENYNTATFLARAEVFNDVLFDESIRGGYEDWDFWINAASHGFWGYTIQEYLFWYRRNDHAAKWENWQSNDKKERFIDQLNQKFKKPFDLIKEYTYDLNKSYGTFPVENIITGSYKSKPGNKPKILFIFPWLNLGGADKFNLDLIEGLSFKGWDICILTTLKSNNPWQSEFSRYTNNIFHLPNIGGYHHYHAYFELFISSNQPDLIVISNSMHGYFSLPFLKAKFSNIPIADYIHCDDPDWLNGGYPRLNTVFSHLLDKTIVSSYQLKEWIESKRVQSKVNSDIEVCYTNIDTTKTYRNLDNRNRIRSSWGIDDDFAVIIYAARLTDQKQPFVLLDTIEKLSRQKENFVCLVCGDGPYFNELKARVEEKGLVGKIWMMGAIKQQQVLEFMDASDIFFLPSKYEGIALSMYEAIAKELTIVGANVGGQAELVNKEAGFLIQPSNPTLEADLYTDILARLVSDSTLRRNFAEAALQNLGENFNINVMYNKMHNIFSAMAKKTSVAHRFVSTNDYSFIYNAFWNKDLVANEIWNEYVYVKGKLTAPEQLKGNAITNIANISSEEWYISEHQKMKQWYHEQYEVLPLWYKRFGHIIKVLKGQRKVLSLIKKAPTE
jgi:glycosyltransferase involved in cell wall biosynthesis